MLKTLAKVFRDWADKFDPPPVPARLPIWEIRNWFLEDYFSNVFGVDLPSRPRSTDEIRHIFDTFGIEYFNGHDGDLDKPCPVKLDVAESEIVFVMANPYGPTAPHIAIVNEIIEDFGASKRYHVMDLTGRVSDLIPCACAIRKLDDIPFGTAPVPHWDGNQKAKELHDAWWDRKPSTSDD